MPNSMRSILAASFLFIYSIAISQESNVLIKGIVTDSKTHEVLSNVQFFHANILLSTSDIKGNFEFRTDSGKIDIKANYIGYLPFEKAYFSEAKQILIINIELEPVTNELNEVVVSANKTEQKSSDLSVSMSIIKPLEITKIHIVSAEEIINQTNGIEIMDGQASIRGGSGFSYGAGSRVLALIDGLPAIAPDAGNIRWQFLPLENLSQIEIIKGASSVLYGSSALNGIINFRTAEADTIPIIRFSVSTGIFDNPKQKNWVWWNSPRMYSDASFSYSKRFNNTEIGIGTNFLLDNGYRKLNDEKLGRVNLKIKQHSSKLKGLSYGAGLNAGYNIKRDFILWEDAEFGALKQNETTATQMFGYFFTIDPFIGLKRSDRTSQDIRMRFQISENDFPDNSQNNSHSLSNYTEYQLIHQLFNKLVLNFGISHTYNKIISNFYGDHTGNNLAGYSQLDYKLFKKIKISAGLRLEYNTLDDINDKIVPVFRTGINYHVAKYTFIRSSFGQGYRYPSIAEKFAATTLGAVKIFPNPEIRSESGWTSEIGVKQGIQIGKVTGQADLSVFYSQNTDMIEYVFAYYPDPITQVYDYGFRASNIENSRVYGAETEFQLVKNIGRVKTSFGAGYTYIYPVEFNKASGESTQTWLKYRRKHAAKFNMSAMYKKFELGFYCYFKSKTLNIDEVFLDALTRESLLPGFYDYWTENNTASFAVDGYLSYRLTDKLKFSFAVKNFTNTEYMGRPGDILPQRFYSFQISGRF
jgi:iron complex outermembrane receptor protein